MTALRSLIHAVLSLIAAPCRCTSSSSSSDRKAYDPSSRVLLPALVRDLQIDYTATSLTVPEKTVFRYKLEGHDRDWQDVGTRRQAFYNDLDPGNYRFRVIASNNSGMWNEGRRGTRLLHCARVLADLVVPRILCRRVAAFICGRCTGAACDDSRASST